MRVIISFSTKPERQNNKGESINIMVAFDESLNQRVVEQTMEKYSETLKGKYGFKKVTLKKESVSQYEFICQPNRQMEQPASEESFINYLTLIGFVGANGMIEFEIMESNRLLTIYNRYSAREKSEQSFNKFRSHKSFMDKKEFSRLYQKLLLTRDTIEQLSYQSEQLIDWVGKIEDCDIILDYINDFYWDMGFFVMIDYKVKKELRYFSDFYDNMKESHILTET